MRFSLRLEQLGERVTPSASTNDFYGVAASTTSQVVPGEIGAENADLAHSGFAGAINEQFGQIHGVENFQ